MPTIAVMTISSGGELRRTSLSETVERDQGFEQCGQRPQRHHGGALARGPVGVVMRFDKNRGDSGGRRGAGEDRAELALSTRTVAKPARLRDRMGRIEHDRVTG